MRTPADPCVGITLRNGYQIQPDPLGEGKIGTVYRATSTHTGLTMACKIIREGRLKDGWQRELEKVRKLQGVPHVVEYHDHDGAHDNNGRPFSWVHFRYVDGYNLRTFISDRPAQLTVSFVDRVLQVCLEVLFSCAEVKIVHGDLHAGNILIAKPDPRIRNSTYEIFVSDFGYGGSHNEKEPKDDFQELANVISDLLQRLPRHSLNARDKILHELLEGFCRKRVRDAGRSVGLTPKVLLEELDAIRRTAENQSASGSRGTGELKTPSDYLTAEALGYRTHEWKILFVPQYMAVGDLLAKTNTVLTGARGCGKTMSFRRMTKLMDVLLGESSGVRGSEQFLGFYFNCRDLLDAFPWVPRSLQAGGEQQVIHFFHLAWLAELFKTLAGADPDECGQYGWLEDLMQRHFSARYERAPAGVKLLGHVRAFIELEKERTRSAALGKSKGFEHWPLARLDFLDDVQRLTAGNVEWAGTKPFYLFLDDYTLPLLPRNLQQALNSIIFKRRSDVFFKVSTEAANTFLTVGPNGKALEIYHDFNLVDLASESLHQDAREKESLLDRIFRPRIKWHAAFADRDFGLKDVLGETPYDYNQLAWQMRNNEKKKRIYYYGKKVFVGLWTSDIRIMVEMFADMLRESNGKLTASAPCIPREVQDRCVRAQGGEMMTFTQSVRDHQLSPRTGGERRDGQTFGNHLKSVVEALASGCRRSCSSSTS